ncbi:MAG: hypothetical protein HYY98_16715 [Burkholderiales bacterium]|nr:hypothetical protein [Burkholderiales bacterium]
MLKKVAIVVAVVAAGWYSQVGGRQINESQVRDFYRQESHAFYSRDPEAICKLISSKYVGTERMTMMGTSQQSTANREQTCESQRHAFESFEKVGDKMGGMLTMEYVQQIDSIEIAPNRKSARVTGTKTLKMGGAIMEFNTRFTEDIEREWGQAKMVRSDTTTRVVMLGDSGMKQSDFFK